MVLRSNKPVIVPLRDESIGMKSDKDAVFLPACKPARSIGRGEPTSPEAVRAHLTGTKRYNRDLNGFASLSNYIPDFYASIVANLKSAGTIITGKTTLSPLGMHHQRRCPHRDNDS